MLKNHVREARSKTKQWYLEAKGHRVLTTSEQLDETSTLQEDLYMQHHPKGESIQILVQMLSIADINPEVGEIAVTVRKIQSGRA